MAFLLRIKFFPALCVVLLLTAGQPLPAAELRAMNALLDTVLSAHVKDGYVDYPAIARNVRFHKYIQALSETDVAALDSEAAQMAFWINAYNAIAIKNVINGLTPISTLDRIKFFRSNDHAVGGRKLDLNSIEEILMDFGDPRVRFTLVGAAYTAPMLQASAYRAEELDQQLDAVTRRFINDNRKNRFSDALRIARLSQLFEWHSQDFGGDDEAVMAFVSNYVNDEVVKKALASGRYKIRYLDYEWNINGNPM